jgi:trimeric autotransporter adhesin
MTTNLNQLIRPVMLLLMLATTAHSQNITNTLPPGGKFIVRDVSNNYLTLDQLTGEVNILKGLRLENTTSLSLGVIFKGADRFIHNYSQDGVNGYNAFIGINSGNFTMTGGYNLALGEETLFSNTDGWGNTALGFQSLSSNTTGFQNTGVGLGSLQNNTTANNNTAVGYLSLNSNTIGSENTALGQASLQSNTTGTQNTASGSGSLQYNTIGFENTASGSASLFTNTTGNFNTAMGTYSSYANTAGHRNTSVGARSLYSNTEGSYNIALGYVSLFSNTIGAYNTAVGVQSLYYNSNGDGNTAIGYTAGRDITTGSNLTCLGYQSEPSTGVAENQITLGNSFVVSLRCAATTITSLSDVRDKKNIRDLNLGIDFLMKIKPRLYNWDKREWYDDNKSDGSKMKEEPTAGFIAQELDEAQTTGKAEWLNLVLKNNPEKLEATPGNLLPIMVKAIQDLKKENDELTSANDKLKNKIENVQAANEELKGTTVGLTDRLSKFEQMQNMLITEIEKLKTNNNESIKVSLGEK